MPRRSWWARTRLLSWHRLLTPGGMLAVTGAARIRGWERVLNWQDAHTWAQVRYLVRRAVWTPVRTWKEAAQAVADFGSEVEAVSGVQPREQHRQLWWLGMRYGMHASSYLDYQFYRPERRRRAAAFLQEREFFRVGRWLNRELPRSDRYPIADKLAFSSWCRENNLPAVTTLLEFERGTMAVSHVSTESATVLPPSDLFSKPSDGTGGNGTERWLYEKMDSGENAWIGRDGRVRSEPELLTEIANRSLGLSTNSGSTTLRMLLQPCLRNHQNLLPLTPGGLSTVRVVTYRAPGGQARLLRAIYKMPTGDAPADNFHFGGIIAEVDLGTGQLLSALRRQGRVLLKVERHPDTGSVIEGHQIPLWKDTIALTLKALTAAHGRPSIGWDVAVTDEGPVLIEGNTMSNPDIAQVPSGEPLSDTPFVAAYEAYIRSCLGI